MSKKIYLVLGCFDSDEDKKIINFWDKNCNHYVFSCTRKYLNLNENITDYDKNVNDIVATNQIVIFIDPLCKVDNIKNIISFYCSSDYYIDIDDNDVITKHGITDIILFNNINDEILKLINYDYKIKKQLRFMLELLLQYALVSVIFYKQIETISDKYISTEFSSVTEYIDSTITPWYKCPEEGTDAVENKDICDHLYLIGYIFDYVGETFKIKTTTNYRINLEINDKIKSQLTKIINQNEFVKDLPKTGGNFYYQKYVKYKHKYINLKKIYYHNI
jgi:hypothetical protein